MSLWLKKRLGLWTVVSLLICALLWNSGVLRAQDWGDMSERPKLTRDKAATEFGELLDYLTSQNNFGYSAGRLPASISLKSERELGYHVHELMFLMVRQWKQPDQIVKVQSEGSGTATVTLEKNLNPPIRPLVLVEENGSWGVDLVETYAKWNNLEGSAKAEAIYKLTGAILEGLPNTEAIQRSFCQSNMKQIMQGMLQYTDDYDENFPLAKNWIDNLQPYVKNEEIFNCPSLPKGQQYGYAYNSKLARKAKESLQKRDDIIAVYETSVLKRSAYGMGENLAFRHQGGANYAFLDGHIKWFDKSQTPSFNIGPVNRLKRTSIVNPYPPTQP